MDSGSSAARAGVIGEFLMRQEEIVRLIAQSSAARWQRVRVASPVASLIRMNIGDAFTLLVRHEERHFKQIDRVLERAGAANRVRLPSSSPR